MTERTSKSARITALGLRIAAASLLFTAATWLFGDDIACRAGLSWGICESSNSPSQASPASLTPEHSSTQLPSSARAIAVFTSPTPGSSIQVGQTVEVAGHVSHLPAGETVWLLSVDSAEPGLFYFNSEGPLAVVDGPWRKTDVNVAHESIRNLQMSYVVVQARHDCSQRLQTASKRDGIYLPPSCVELARVTLLVR